MLSTGIKEGILNDDINWKVTPYITGIEATTGDVPDAVLIEGYGYFEFVDVEIGSTLVALGAAATVGTASIDFTNIADGLSRDVPYLIKFYVGTTRLRAGFDYTAAGREITVQAIFAATDTVEGMVLKVITALDERENKFSIGEPTPFTYSLNGADAKVLDIVFTEPEFVLKSVTYKDPVNGKERDLTFTEVPGSEGKTTGKLLEESVRISMDEVMDPYGVKRGTNVEIDVVYDEMYWRMNHNSLKKISYTANKGPIGRVTEFNVFVNTSKAPLAFTYLEAFLDQIALP